jgi:hypothetical protein
MYSGDERFYGTTQVTSIPYTISLVLLLLDSLERGKGGV